MSNDSTKTSPDLSAVLKDLAAQEPIFHRPEFACTKDDFERLMAPGYWEVGASGQIYSRDFILEHLRTTPPVDAALAGWTTSDFQCKELSPNIFLLTYRLSQGDRTTHRATIWQRCEDVWHILYHQGTLAQSDRP